MCYACNMCNRCGRADEMKSKIGRRVCPQCGALVFEGKTIECPICGAILPPPIIDPPGSHITQ